MKKIQPKFYENVQNEGDLGRSAWRRSKGSRMGKGKPWTKLSRNPMLQNEELKDEEHNQRWEHQEKIKKI